MKDLRPNAVCVAHNIVCIVGKALPHPMGVFPTHLDGSQNMCIGSLTALGRQSCKAWPNHAGQLVGVELVHAKVLRVATKTYLHLPY